MTESQPRKRIPAAVIYIAVVVAVMAAGYVWSRLMPASPDTDWQAKYAADQARQARYDLEHPWSYSYNTNPQRDGVMFEAFVHTNEKVVASAGWTEDGLAYLYLRYQAKTGFDAWVRIDGNAKIVCAPQGCQVPVRIDGGPATSYPAIGTADHSPDTLFILNADTLLKALKTSKAAIVTIMLDKKGAVPLAFNTRGLVWKGPAPAAHS
jgi:hypothetical protein